MSRMLLPTEKNLEEISNANFHQDFGVGIPERISLLQLYRWLGFGFTPLPRNIELQLSHLPIFDPRIRELIIKVNVSKKVIEKVKQLLVDGILVAKGRIEDSDATIPTEYWHLPLQSIRWERSATTVDEFQIRVFSESRKEAHIAASRLVNEYKREYGTLTYSEVSVATEEVIRILDSFRIADDYVLKLKEQVRFHSYPFSPPRAQHPG